MLVKIHESYRKIIAVCDESLIGKKFEEGNVQLDIRQDFYEGELMNEEEVIELLKDAATEDSTFNIVGEDSIKSAIKAGIIDEKGLIRVQGIPHALGLI
jgi:hypothetical protein